MTTHNKRVDQGGKVKQRARVVSSDAVRLAVRCVKNAVLADYALRAGEHARLLRLVLNEAEGLAWQTEFPQLVFLALAVEKAEAAVAWHQRQTALRRPAAEVAFAE